MAHVWWTWEDVEIMDKIERRFKEVHIGSFLSLFSVYDWRDSGIMERLTENPCSPLYKETFNELTEI